MTQVGLLIPQGYFGEFDGWQPVAAWQRMLALAERGRALGFGSIWVGEHVLSKWDPTALMFDCTTVATALAARVPDVDLGFTVINSTFRLPAMTAKYAGTLDAISGGRLILGIGAGWQIRDYDAFGYPFGDAPARLRALDADLPRTIARMAAGNPSPTRRIPILVGGGGEKVTLRIAAQHADVWHGFGDAETLQRKNGILDDHCRRLGRDPGEIERSAGVDPKRLEAGDRLLAVGITQLTLGMDAREFDTGAIRSWVAWRDERNAVRGA